MTDEIETIIQRMTDEELNSLEMQAHVYRAAMQDNPDGFESFFYVITGMKLAKHSRKQVEGIYAARGMKKYVGLEAFRGSAKTTVMTCFFAFRIGKEPNRSNLLIQVGDDIATDNAKKVADIIQYNPGWKKIFPNVEPDIEMGWGASGYQVKRVDISYGEWRQLNSTRKDPSFLGVGYKSRAIIGKRPDGVLLVDDILDENNTSSEREMENVEKILTGTIFPTMTKDTWLIFAYTPWKDNDPVVKQTRGENFILIKTPVFEYAVDGEDEFEGERVNITWKDNDTFSLASIKKKKELSGQIEFARMYLLDLSKTTNSIFKYQLYPATAINPKWAIIGGIDYAGTMLKKTNTDYFAMAYIAKHPEGGAVVVDGVLDRCTQSQSEQYALRAQEIFPNWQFSVVEGDGKGEEFIQMMMRHPKFRILPMKTGGKGKDERLVRQMSPWLESMRVRISDANTPFLNELRRELDQYPLSEHDDALDAIYWGLRGMPDVLQVHEEESIPSTKKKRRHNPFNAVGRK